MQGEKGEVGPEGTPGQTGLPGKNVSKLLKFTLIQIYYNAPTHPPTQGQPGVDGPPGPPVSY